MLIGRSAIVSALCFSMFSGVLGGSALAADAPSPPSYEMTLQEAWIAMPDGVRLAADLYLAPCGGDPCACNLTVAVPEAGEGGRSGGSS